MTEWLNWTDPRFVLTFHILSCMTLIKSLNFSFLIRKMGTTMILQPFRLHMCLQRAGGPERAFWVPESGTKMNYSATWGEGNLLFRGMCAIPKVKYWFKPNDIYFWTMIQNSDWDDASVFWGPTGVNDYCLRSLPTLALPVTLSLLTTSTVKSHSKERRKALALLSVSLISSIATSSCYGYLS